MTPGIEAVAHHGITVRSLEEALTFFGGVLGFQAGPRIDLDEEFSAGVTGIPGVRVSAMFLDAPGLHIELLEYDVPRDRPGVGASSSDPGAAHVALYVEEIDRLVAPAAHVGWHLAGEIQPITTGPRAGGKAAYLKNADGAVVELVQRPTPATAGGVDGSTPPAREETP